MLVSSAPTEKKQLQRCDCFFRLVLSFPRFSRRETWDFLEPAAEKPKKRKNMPYFGISNKITIFATEYHP